MFTKNLLLILNLVLFSYSSSFAKSRNKHIEQKFIVLDVSPVKFKSTSRLCQIDLQEEKSFGFKPIIYKASASSVICDFKKGHIVDLGIHSPYCDMIWSEEHPPGSADQVACTTDREWFVMTYTHFNEDDELVTSHWNYDYKKHTYKKDVLDPAGAPARHRARAMKSLMISDCYPIERKLLSDQQIGDCAKEVEKIVTRKAITNKNPELCKQVELNKGVVPFDRTYAECAIAVIADLKKPALCEQYFYKDVEDWYMNTIFKDCLWKLNDVQYCDSIPKTKGQIKNLCYSATGTCEKVTGDFEKTQCPYYKDRSRK